MESTELSIANTPRFSFLIDAISSTGCEIDRVSRAADMSEQ
jgi:hypothetical protein